MHLSDARSNASLRSPAAALAEGEKCRRSVAIFSLSFVNGSISCCLLRSYRAPPCLHTAPRRQGDQCSPEASVCGHLYPMFNAVFSSSNAEVGDARDLSSSDSESSNDNDNHDSSTVFDDKEGGAAVIEGIEKIKGRRSKSISAKKRSNSTAGQSSSDGSRPSSRESNISMNSTQLEAMQLSLLKPSNALQMGTPVVPPRKRLETLKLSTNNVEDTPTWFLVLSPRETRGIGGPFSINQLRKMYKYNEFGDNSMMWQEGLKNWVQLCYLHSLRSQLIQLPSLPRRQDADEVAMHNNDSVFNPIPAIPTNDQVRRVKSLYDISLGRTCNRCGSHAAGFSDVVGKQEPDLNELRVDFGSTNAASEVIPSFLFIGAKDSSKNTAIKELQATLVINCTEDLKTPQERVPYYRCRKMPFAEKPQGEVPADFDNIIDMLERVYDWIEFERVLPERAKESDPIPEYYRGKTDKYGRQLERLLPPRKIEKGVKELYNSRVLLFSRHGNDRVSLIAAAFLIKHYGLTVENAMEIVIKSRKSAELSPSYKYVLTEWSKRYTMGEMFCADCIQVGLANMKDSAGNIIPNSSSGHDNNRIYEEIAKSIRAEEGNNRSDTSAASTEAIAVIGDLKHCLPQVFVGSTDSILKRISTSTLLSPSTAIPDAPPKFTGLMDLSLNGRKIGDSVATTLFRSLGLCGVALQVRVLELRNNDIGSKGLQALANCLTCADTEARDWAYGHLLHLDLSHNSVGGEDNDGLLALNYLLKGHNTIISVSLSNNCILDEGSAIFFDSFVMFEDKESKKESDDNSGDDRSRSRNSKSKHNSKGDSKRKPSVSSGSGAKRIKPKCNYSVTSLDYTSNEMGHKAINALDGVLRANKSIVRLNLDGSTGMPSKPFKTLLNALRIYNTTLEDLKIADVPFSVKSTGNIFKIFAGHDIALTALSVSRCELTSLHVNSFGGYIRMAKYLMEIDISGNRLGDTGAEYLAAGIRGSPISSKELKRNIAGPSRKFGASEYMTSDELAHLLSLEKDVTIPPLRRIDVSSCSLEYAGCKDILLACATRDCILYLDISDNKFTALSGEERPSIEKDESFLTALAACSFTTFRMDRCSLQSQGAIALFNILSFAPEVKGVEPKNLVNSNDKGLKSTLKVLSIVENDIHDPAAPALCDFIRSNIVIQHLDIGFNHFTDKSNVYFSKATEILSQSVDADKLYSLNVNMIGNKGNPYALGTPGMAKSKINFRFGTTGRRENEFVEGSLRNNFEHISLYSRAHFLSRKYYDDKYSKDFTETRTCAISSLM